MANSYDVEFDYAGNNSTTLNDKGFISGQLSRNYTITLDSVNSNDNELTVRFQCQARGLLPREGDVHPNSFLYRCSGVDVRQESPLYYTATARYEQAARPADEDESDSDAPWNLPAEVSYSSVKTEGEIDEDANEEPIENPGTGEPVQGITKPITDLQMVVTKNFLDFNPASIYEFNDAVNNDTYFGFPAGTVKVDDISANRSFHDQQEFYKVTVKFVIRKPHNTTAAKAWYHRRVIKGFYELKNSQVIRCVDDEKQPVTSPVYLDQNGERLGTGDNREFQELEILESKDLSQMGL